MLVSLTQIEKETNQMMQEKTTIITTKESAVKTFNLAMTQNRPTMPMMYFPNSSVTINYNFNK